MILQLVLVLLGIAGAVTAAYVWEVRIRDRVSVHRILDPDDSHAEAVLDLYEKKFGAMDTNYTREELLQFLDASPAFGDDRVSKAENIVLVAVYHRDVVGFIMCHYYRRDKKAIISYFGIDRDVLEARRSAADRLVGALKRVLLDGKHPCDFVFFDLRGVDDGTPKKLARRRRARPSKFRQSTARAGFSAYLLDFNYVSPRVSLEEGAREAPAFLMCVPIVRELPDPMPQGLLLEFLEFVYHSCYGDLYPLLDERFGPYHSYLKGLLQHYRSSLPEQIRAH